MIDSEKERARLDLIYGIRNALTAARGRLGQIDRIIDDLESYVGGSPSASAQRAIESCRNIRQEIESAIGFLSRAAAAAEELDVEEPDSDVDGMMGGGF